MFSMGLFGEGNPRLPSLVIYHIPVIPVIAAGTPRKVIDFGGARRVGEADEIVLQTLPYRAPEVA